MAKSDNPHGTSEVLGVRLHDARVNSHLTMEMLGKKTKVSHSQISRIERGRFKRISKNVQIMCNFFEIDWHEQPAQGDVAALITRLHRAASASPQWAKVVNAFVEAVEALQDVESQRL